MRHDLLGYLLGALDGSEQDAIRNQLEHDVELRRELMDWKRRLGALEQQPVEFDPPAGLAEATCRRVAELQRGEPVLAGRAAAMSHTSEVAGRPRRGSLIDVVIAAGIFVAASFLFLPIIANSREEAQLLACQDRQSQVVQGGSRYAALHGSFPSPPVQAANSFTGVIPLTLVEREFVSAKDTVCPSTAFVPNATHSSVTSLMPSTWLSQRRQGRQQQGSQERGSQERGNQQQADEQIALRKWFQSGFAYPLGHVSPQGRYVPLRVNESPYVAYLADIPDYYRHHAPQSRHGNRINVCFGDSSCRTISTAIVHNDSTGLWDDIFRNDEGEETAPGLHALDAVLVRGDAQIDFRRVDRVRMTVPRSLPVDSDATVDFFSTSPGSR